MTSPEEPTIDLSLCWVDGSYGAPAEEVNGTEIQEDAFGVDALGLAFGQLPRPRRGPLSSEELVDELLDERFGVWAGRKHPRHPPPGSTEPLWQ